VKFDFSHSKLVIEPVAKPWEIEKGPAKMGMQPMKI
jgi:hypothetical protein